MHSQGISQFYLHTPRSSANGMDRTCLLTYLHLSDWGCRFEVLYIFSLNLFTCLN